MKGQLLRKAFEGDGLVCLRRGVYMYSVLLYLYVIAQGGGIPEPSRTSAESR
jgi:hypothetical protein